MNSKRLTTPVLVADGNLIHAQRTADTLQEQRARRQAQDERPLRPDLPEFALLRDRLREANRENRAVATQYPAMLTALQTISLRLTTDFGEHIERVLASGAWACEGIDLRNLPYDDIVLDLVLRTDERPFALYIQLAETVFANLPDEDILIQFHLVTRPEWHHALTLAQASGQEDPPRHSFPESGMSGGGVTPDIKRK